MLYFCSSIQSPLSLYEELMWPHDAELEFSADYENNRIIISVKDEKMKRPAL